VVLVAEVLETAVVVGEALVLAWLDAVVAVGEMTASLSGLGLLVLRSETLLARWSAVPATIKADNAKTATTPNTMAATLTNHRFEPAPA
jgi:hypothetical protein